MLTARQLRELRGTDVPDLDGRAVEAGDELIDEATGAAIAAAALKLVGVQFQHQGRIPAHGLDCAGVLLAACKEGGVPFEWPYAYRMDPDPQLLLQGLAKACARVSASQVGDFIALCLPGSRLPKHLAVDVGDGNIVHVYGRTSRVRVDYLAAWEDQVHSIWRRKWHR